MSESWSESLISDDETETRDAHPARGAIPRTATEAPVEIVPYDPAWPVKFDEEAAILRRVPASWLVGTIEHIGSTAVPGLAAKPVIDIMAGVETLEASRGAIAAASDLSYCYWPYQADREHWFCKPSTAHQLAEIGRAHV